MTIEGYTDPLNEGDYLTLTCKVTPPDAQLDFPLRILFTKEGASTPRELVVGWTYSKRNVTTADGGEYRCEAGRLGESVVVEILAAQDSGNVAAQSQTNVAKAAPIIGISIAVFIVFIITTIYVLHRRRLHNQEINDEYLNETDGRKYPRKYASHHFFYNHMNMYN